MAKNPIVGYTMVYPAKGGLETIAIPGLQTVGRCTSGSNFLVDINGAKRKSPGAIQQSVTPPNIIASQPGFSRGLFDFWRTNSMTGIKSRRTVAVSNGKIWADNSDGVYLNVTGALSIVPQNTCSMETFFGLLVMAFNVNPNSLPVSYDQSGAAVNLGNDESVPPPNSKYLRTWLDRLWHGGIKGEPDILIGSVVDDPTGYNPTDGAQEISLDQGDQDPIGITALFPPFYGQMTVAKRRSLYYISFDGTNFDVTNITQGGLGCVSHNGVQGFDVDVVFPSERGIHSLMSTNKLGKLDSNPLSVQIQDLYQQNADFGRGDQWTSMYIPESNHYYLSLCTKGSAINDLCLGYNFTLGEWDVINQNIASMCKYVDTTDGFKTKALVLNDTGQIGLLDTTFSNNTVTWFNQLVTMSFTTGIIYPKGANVAEVTFRQLTVFFKPQSVKNSVLQVQWLVNGILSKTFQIPMTSDGEALIGAPGTIIGASKIGGTGIVKNYTQQLNGVGKGIEFIFTHQPVNENDGCEIYGFILEYEYSGDTDKTQSQ